MDNQVDQKQKAFIDQITSLHKSAGFTSIKPQDQSDYYANLIQTAVNDPFSLVGDNTQTPTNRVLNRFKKRDNPEELTLQAIGENLGLSNIGLIGFDTDSPEIKFGTLGFHDASVTANMAGGLHELGATNQNAMYAQAALAGNTDIFRTSTAYEPKQELVDLYKTVTTIDPSGSYYVDDAGTPITADSGLIDVDPKYATNNPIGPNTVVGEGPEGTLITAKDRMPKTYKTVDRGLQDLELSSYERDFYNYNTDAVNNWGRLGRIGNYGQADRSIGFIDLSVIPVLDTIQTMIFPELYNPAVVARKQSNKIDAPALIKSIKERDPDLYFTMEQEGIDFNTLAQMETAGEFRSYVNGTFQKNAIARGIAITKARSGWLEYKAREGLFMVYGTLTSGDAVGQALITGATMGTNLAVSGGLSLSSRAALSSGSITARVANTGVTVSRNIERATSFARGMNTVTKYLPVNLPNVVIEYGLSKLPNLSRNLARSSWYVKYPSKLGLWAAGQAIEGFVEEGATDILNQGLEIAYGLRHSYDPSQTIDQAVVGALMEPVLGAALTPGFIGANWSSNLTMNALINRVPSMLGIPAQRVSAFNAYLSATQGNWNDLTPLQRKQREAFITRALISEQTLGRYTFGKYAKAETTMERLSQLGLRIQTTEGPISDVDFVEAGFHLATFMETLTNTYVTNSPQDAERIALINQGIEQNIFKVEDGNIKLSETETEFALVLLASGIFGNQSRDTQLNYVLQRINEAKEQRLKKENQDLFDSLEQAQKENNTEKVEEIKEKIQEKIEEIERDTGFEEEQRKEIIDRFNLFRQVVTDEAFEASGKRVDPVTESAVQRSNDRLEAHLTRANQTISKQNKQEETEPQPSAPIPQAEPASSIPDPVDQPKPIEPTSETTTQAQEKEGITHGEAKDLIDRYLKLWDSNDTSSAAAFRLLFNDNKKAFETFINAVLLSDKTKEGTDNALSTLVILVEAKQIELAQNMIKNPTLKPC